MKKYLFLILVIPIFTIGFQACASASSSVKGEMTTVNTLAGYSYDAIILLENIWEYAKIAKTNEGNYILYASIKTNGNRPGSVIIYIDGNRYNISDPTDWNINDVSVTQYYTAELWSCNKQLSRSVIDALLNANVVTIRAVGGNAYMGVDNGVDVSSILPQLKEFLSK